MRESGPRRRALARGLRNRSPLIVLVALLLAVAALAGLQWFVASGAFTAIPERLMLRIPNDDYVNVSYRVAELKRRPPAGPVVYLFGGSGAMEIIRSEDTLAAAVSADAGAPVRVVSLAAHAQSLGETLALIDNLPRGRGLLAIGLSPNRFTNGPATDASQLSGSPLALTSPHLATLLAGRTSLKKHLPGQLSGVFDFVLSYLNQRVFTSSPDLGLITYTGHYFGDGPVAALPAKLKGQAIELARERPQYAANIAYNLAVRDAHLWRARHRRAAPGGPDRERLRRPVPSRELGPRQVDAAVCPRPRRRAALRGGGLGLTAGWPRVDGLFAQGDGLGLTAARLVDNFSQP